jgi:anti-sigma factor RsiW
MNCQDMEKFIHVYLDREFAEEDRADFERHLTSCERCRNLARFEQRFKQQLKTGLAHPPLGLEQREALRDRLRQTLDHAPLRRAQHPVGRWAVRLLPAAAAAGLVLALVLRPEPTPSAALLHSVTLAQMAAPLEVRSPDPRAVRDWYEGKLDFRIDPPRFRDGRTALVGGRLGHVDSQQAAHLIYRRGDRRINVVMFRPRTNPFEGMRRRQIGNKNIYYGKRRGQAVAAFAHRGVVYTITGEVPPPELDALVRDVVGPSPIPPAARRYDALPASAPGGP